MRLQHHLFTRHMPVEIEWAGANRIPGVIIAVLGDGLLADDIALLIAYEMQQEDWIKIRQGH
jgi:hypothetical protein